MILRRSPDAARFGSIGVDESGRVRSLLGTPENQDVREELMFTGVHVLAPEAFAAMPEYGCVIRTAYRQWVDSGALVLGIVDDSPWADLGTVFEYHRLNLELASGSFTWPGVLPRGDCILAEDIEVSARICRSVVGVGAQLADGVTLDRCVVWSGTRIDRPAHNAVITPEHRLVVSSSPSPWQGPR
jgi:NDP-sugar pyrophosphorylase family protein